METRHLSYCFTALPGGGCKFVGSKKKKTGEKDFVRSWKLIETTNLNAYSQINDCYRSFVFTEIKYRIAVADILLFTRRDFAPGFERDLANEFKQSNERKIHNRISNGAASRSTNLTLKSFHLQRTTDDAVIKVFRKGSAFH